MFKSQNTLYMALAEYFNVPTKFETDYFKKYIS